MRELFLWNSKSLGSNFHIFGFDLNYLSLEHMTPNFKAELKRLCAFSVL